MWYEIDVSWWGIRALQFLGLARDIKQISKMQIAAANLRGKELRRAA